MIFRVLNTKENEKSNYEDFEIESAFGCDVFYDHNCLKEEYEQTLTDMDEEEKAEYIEYWQRHGNTVFENKKDYYKEMIEWETWTSPNGIKAVNQVIEIL